MKKYIAALDEGTTSTRAIIFDREQNILGISQKEFTQIFPKPGYVEHDAEEIFEAQKQVLHEAAEAAGIGPEEIAGIGITNQRETTIVWDKNTGKPVYNAIVWQCRRTADFCEEIKSRGLEDKIREKTGLKIDAYFSASKIRWILDNVEGARERAEKGELIFGTIDTWLVWKLTGGKVHVTDYTNASRTLLFNIKELKWDDELLEIFDIPKAMLPEVRSCSEIYGSYNMDGVEVPISGMAGDQQSSMFGQACFERGQAKNTYGTGCFLLMNMGEECRISDGGLVTTIGIGLKDKINYAMEGSVFIGGAVIQWLRDGLRIIKSSGESGDIAESLEDNGGVYFVPAFTGLGAPYWDMYARGAILGLTRGTTQEHIVRAAVESMGFQTMELLTSVEAESGIKIDGMRVDGGASRDSFLMQFQADISRISILRSAVSETTALGAAYLAGLATGVWSGLDEIAAMHKIGNEYKPQMEEEKAKKLSAEWKTAVSRVLTR